MWMAQPAGPVWTLLAEEEGCGEAGDQGFGGARLCRCGEQHAMAGAV